VSPSGSGAGTGACPYGASLPACVATVWPNVVAALPRGWRTGLSEARRVSPRVWRIEQSDGRILALKLAAEHAPLDVEVQALRWLGRHRCSVPAVLAVSPERPPHWVALEWCGDQTLDAAAQGAGAARRARLGRELAVVLAEIEAAFAPFTARAQADAPRWQAQTRALRAQAAPWFAQAPATLAWLLGRDLPPEVASSLRRAGEVALRAPLGAGSLDYSASNVVVGPDRLVVVDFAAIGVDWPARRFVQYGTATGAAAREPPRGTFATVVTPGALRAYAARTAALQRAPVEAVEQEVDAHDLLLLLAAGEHLRLIQAGRAEAERALAWANVPERRRALLALIRRRLVRHGPAEAVRSWVRTQTEPPQHGEHGAVERDPRRARCERKLDRLNWPAADERSRIASTPSPAAGQVPPR
jgi:hypothetical protein